MARSSVGALMRPRLRLTKRAGSPTGCDTQDVLELGARNAELVGECFEVVASPEASEDVADTRPAAAEDRLPKGPSRVDDHLGALIGGQPQESGIAIRRVIDPLEVVLDDVSEDMLAAPYHHQLAGKVCIRGSRLLRVVEEEFGAVSEQAPRSQGVVDAKVVGEYRQSWTNPLQGDAGSAHGCQHHAFGEADEGDRRRSWAEPLDRGDNR